jgi:anaerobic nitric oxide reductase flavorubredoxin
MAAVTVLPGIHWVGAVDWSVRNFHGFTYTTKRGTTYNSYLIMDEKITLVDAVHASFCDELVGNISQVVPLEKIDYIIANHVEPDHSGSLPRIRKLCPNAKIVCNVRCRDGLNKYYQGGWDYQIVKTGEKLNLGKRTLMFVEAPMLHWPDSMFTYVVEDALLMPNDAFGQHIATSQRFDDEIDQFELMDEAAKYYGNILWPLGQLVVKKIEDVQKLGIPIKMIAPSHGIIWRKDPGKIVGSYLKWGRNETRPKAVIVFETMWGSTERMARKMVEALAEAKVDVKLCDINRTDRTEIVKDMLDAKGFMFGSSTHDGDMLPGMAGFIHLLKGFKPKNRIACSFGSFGWSGEAAGKIEAVLKEAGIEIVQPALTVKYAPSGDELKRCFDFGREFASKLQ